MKRTKGNSERGITLVALIITIIVMLILVAVTVKILVDSDIIGKSEEAGALYRSAYAGEGAKVSDETIQGDVRHDTVEGYLQDICEHNDFVDGVCTKCGINKQDICEHNNIEDGKCTECGRGCPHNFGEDGKCTKCGIELISFKIFNKEYSAEKGMSFIQWVASDYNIDGFVWSLMDNPVSHYLALMEGSVAHIVLNNALDGYSRPVMDIDEIEPSADYGLYGNINIVNGTIYVDSTPYTYTLPETITNWFRCGGIDGLPNFSTVTNEGDEYVVIYRDGITYCLMNADNEWVSYWDSFTNGDRFTTVPKE